MALVVANNQHKAIIIAQVYGIGRHLAVIVGSQLLGLLDRQYINSLD